MTKVVFMGTPAFSAPILEALIQEEYEIQAVVTQPDRPVGRKHQLKPSPVKEVALKHGLKVMQPEKISGSSEMDEIIDLNPDLIVTAAFGQFLPEKLLAVPQFGAINVHASLLPKYRGGAPVHYALINGDEETGVTIMYMIKKMDAGDMLAQERIPITKMDDVGTLFDKLSLLGRDMLIEIIPSLLNGEVEAIPQNEKLVTFSPNIKPEEEVISWEKTATEIDCQVRGMRPFPGAYTFLEDKRLKLWKTAVQDEHTTASSGTIIAIAKHELQVAAANGTVLAIHELQLAGKARQTVTEFLNGSGQNLEIGATLG